MVRASLKTNLTYFHIFDFPFLAIKPPFFQVISALSTVHRTHVTVSPLIRWWSGPVAELYFLGSEEEQGLVEEAMAMLAASASVCNVTFDVSSLQITTEVGKRRAIKAVYLLQL